MLLAALVLLAKFIVEGIRQKHPKQVFLTLTIVLSLLVGAYLGLLRFITSM